jgi:HAD superfamily hydrolase (TIGR01509 family)
VAVSHILFDNDGVLVDTEKLYYEACRQGLSSLGVELTHALFAEYSLTRGVSCFEIAIEAGAMSRDELPALRDQRDDTFSQLLATSNCAMPGAEDAVRELAGHFTLGVVTSAKRRHFELSHSGAEMSRHFAFDYAREDYERSKPDPEPYLTAVVAQNLEADLCVVVEDSPRGLESALAAGLRCIVIPNPMAPRSSFARATACLESIDELATALDRL